MSTYTCMQCHVIRAHTAGDGDGRCGSAGGAYACIGVGGACRPGQCCQDTVLRIEHSLDSQRLSS